MSILTPSESSSLYCSSFLSVPINLWLSFAFKSGIQLVPIENFLGFFCHFWPLVCPITYHGLPFRCIVNTGSLGLSVFFFFPQKSESIPRLMPKQGGPYSPASASTLGTPGPSRQIGLISLESISCAPPFSPEIKVPLLVGAEGPTVPLFTGALPISLLRWGIG